MDLNQLKEYAAKCESGYEAMLDRISESVCADPAVLLVLVAGPSCAGKTTTTLKLSKKLADSGKPVYHISLDDFYKNREDTPMGPDGKPDHETIESLDLDCLHHVLERLCRGEAVYVPEFDFIAKRRSNKWRRIDMEPGGVCIIEGLHALNPLICERYADESRICRVFLDPQDNLKYGFTKYELRRVRRLVRDYYNRASSAENTLRMWHGVREGEKKWIYPFAGNADYVVDTCFEYEPAVLRNKAVEILSSVTADSEHYAKTQVLLGKLIPIEPMSEEIVPAGSLLHEFI